MDLLVPSVEQLDLAARELNPSKPIRSRLSLILTDNVVELLAHSKCKEMIGWDELFARTGNPNYGPSEKRDALGRNFDQKIRFLTRHKQLTSDQRDLAIGLHRFRNEAYHVGILHDDIIFDLAHAYHSLACQFLSDLRPGSWRVPSKDEFSEAAHRHLVGSTFLSLDWTSVRKSLDAARPTRDRSLATALAESAQRRLEAVDEALEFLVSDSPRPTTAQDVLDLVQDGEIPVTAGTLQRWKARATGIARAKGEADALRRFNQLINEFSDFEEQAVEAAMHLDMWIESEIDRMRGA